MWQIICNMKYKELKNLHLLELYTLMAHTWNSSALSPCCSLTDYMLLDHTAWQAQVTPGVFLPATPVHHMWQLN